MFGGFKTVAAIPTLLIAEGSPGDNDTQPLLLDVSHTTLTVTAEQFGSLKKLLTC